MKTVIIGASNNPSRVSYETARRLHHDGADFIPVGIKKGEVFGREILDIRNRPHIEEVHTITLYLGPQNQSEYFEYILQLNPKRIIFNPGTENDELRNLAESQGIQTEYSCTLTMMTVGFY